MIPEIFADGIGDISFGNGVIRVDLVSLSATAKDDKGQPLRELRQRVIMSPQGFLETYAAMENVLQKLVEMGVISKRPAQPAAAQPGAAQAPVIPPKPVSPNFG